MYHVIRPPQRGPPGFKQDSSVAAPAPMAPPEYPPEYPPEPVATALAAAASPGSGLSGSSGAGAELGASGYDGQGAGWSSQFREGVRKSPLSAPVARGGRQPALSAVRWLLEQAAATSPAPKVDNTSRSWDDQPGPKIDKLAPNPELPVPSAKDRLTGKDCPAPAPMVSCRPGVGVALAGSSFEDQYEEQDDGDEPEVRAGRGHIPPRACHSQQFATVDYGRDCEFLPRW